MRKELPFAPSADRNISADLHFPDFFQTLGICKAEQDEILEVIHRHFGEE